MKGGILLVNTPYTFTYNTKTPNVSMGCFLILDDSSIEYLRQDEWKRQFV